MNIRNLVSTALECAGLDERDYHVSIQNGDVVFVTVRQILTYRRVIIDIGLGEDGFVSDIMVSEDNLLPVIGLVAYERFIDRMTEETFIYL